MDDAIWQRFCDDVPSAANERLTVLLEFLAENGGARLPRPGLKWINSAVTGDARVATIEARGCVLSGRVSEVDRRSHFFINQITIDEPVKPRPVRRTRRTVDERQGSLDFESRKSGESSHENE
jgi:hypothetical protein